MNYLDKTPEPVETLSPDQAERRKLLWAGVWMFAESTLWLVWSALSMWAQAEEKSRPKALKRPEWYMLENPTRKDLIYRLLADTPRLYAPSTGYDKKLIEYRKNRYLTKDPNFENFLAKYNVRRNAKWKKIKIEKNEPEELLEWWKRLVDEWFLEVVYEICKNENVPFELIFVMLTESYAKKNAHNRRSGADGYWQFMYATWVEKWLIKYEWKWKKRKLIDLRRDKDASSRAAIKYLKYIKAYIQKKTWEESWIYAIHWYNRGMWNLVRKDIPRMKKKRHISIAKYYSGFNREAQNYVVRTFAIREAIIEYYKRWWIDDKWNINLTGVRSTKTKTEKKSQADIAYEKYAKEEEKNTPEENLKRLEEIKKIYLSERENQTHTDEYVESAIRVINIEMEDLIAENPEQFKSKTKINGTEADVWVNKEWDIWLSLSSQWELKNLEIISYEVQEWDTIDEIISITCSSPDKLDEVKEIINKLNPEIRNLYEIAPGQIIKLPARVIETPAMTIREIVIKYYPWYKWDEKEWLAWAYLYLLNWLDKYVWENFQVGRPMLVPIL